MDPEGYFGRIFGAETGSPDARKVLFLAVIIGTGIAFSGVIRYMKIAGGARG